MSEKVTAYYATESEFLALLEEAENNVENEWEETFVSDVQERFGNFKMGMFLSGKQNSILNKIAHGE